MSVLQRHRLCDESKAWKPLKGPPIVFQQFIDTTVSRLRILTTPMSIDSYVCAFGFKKREVSERAKEVFPFLSAVLVVR